MQPIAQEFEIVVPYILALYPIQVLYVFSMLFKPIPAEYPMLVLPRPILLKLLSAPTETQKLALALDVKPIATEL